MVAFFICQSNRFLDAIHIDAPAIRAWRASPGQGRTEGEDCADQLSAFVLPLNHDCQYQPRAGRLIRHIPFAPNVSTHRVGIQLAGADLHGKFHIPPQLDAADIHAQLDQAVKRVALNNQFRTKQ